MRRIIVVLLVALFAAATAFSATAAPVFFHMVGGICTDGTKEDGQLLCSGHITVTVEMVDRYVPERLSPLTLVVTRLRSFVFGMRTVMKP